jgi:hypothetical protein
MKKGNNVVYIGVRVFPGVFSDEKAVSIDLPDGRVINAYVNERDVVSEPPSPEAEEGAAGRLKISVVETSRDSAVIDLPQPSLTAGTRFVVHMAYLK